MGVGARKGPIVTFPTIPPVVDADSVPMPHDWVLTKSPGWAIGDCFVWYCPQCSSKTIVPLGYDQGRSVVSHAANAYRPTPWTMEQNVTPVDCREAFVRNILGE